MGVGDSYVMLDAALGLHGVQGFIVRVLVLQQLMNVSTRLTLAQPGTCSDHV